MFNFFKKKSKEKPSKSSTESPKKPEPSQEPPEAPVLPPHPSMEAVNDFREDERHRLKTASRVELSANPPSYDLLEDKPYEVELVRLPGDDPDRELYDALKSAHLLIISKQYEQAGMLYDIIDPEFKKRFEQLKHKTALRRYYNEVTLYLWCYDAYQLALRRRTHQIPELLRMINQLMKKVASPIDPRPFLRAKSQLSFIRSIR